MRLLFIVLLIVHGLIHLLGFVKAFGFLEVKALSQPVSKPAGVCWMLASLLLIATAILFILKSNNWWLFGLIVGLLSQILVIYYWQDAKFGTIANIIILIISIIGYGTWSFNKKYQREVSRGLKQTAALAHPLLTEIDIQHLPEPVKKYIRYTHSLNKPKVNNFKLAFTGKIRQNAQSAWMPFTSEQYNFQEAVTRLFFMKASMKHLPVAGFHCFKNGRAFMDIRLLSLFKVQYQAGEEMNISETVTFFNDMCCMAPATLIDKRIQWLEADSNKVKAAFTNNDIAIMAWLYFNNKGELTNFISNDRFAAGANNKMQQLQWSTPLKDYKEINGYKLASYADAIYSYPEEDLIYGTFRISDIEYNSKK